MFFQDDSLWVELRDGRTLGVPLAYFPRLLGATPEQRDQYEISGGGTGLHWERAQRFEPLERIQGADYDD